MILEVKIDLFCVEKGVNRMDRDERWRAIPDKNSEYFNMDKIMFIYQYGSKLAKKIAVDEKLKII